MKVLNELLSKYSDAELAHLYKFQITSYLPPTQEKIKEYILQTRGLDESRIESLVATNPTTTFKNDKLREFFEEARDFFSDLMD